MLMAKVDGYAVFSPEVYQQKSKASAAIPPTCQEFHDFKS